MRRLYRIVSWALLAVGVLGTLIMLAPTLMPAPSDVEPITLVQVLPAAMLIFILGAGAAGVVGLLVSIDERLEAIQGAKVSLPSPEA